VIETALAGVLGPATGATWLIPALPISVAPKGTPARPAVDDEGRGDEGMLLSVHDSGALPEIPPPSNGAFDDGAALEPAQFPMPVPGEGMIGLTPGVAISVAPSGMPGAPLGSIMNGDVARAPDDGGVEDVVWAFAATGLPIAPVASHMHRTKAPLCHLSRLRMCGAPNQVARQ
jgi:hypothetical protein